MGFRIQYKSLCSVTVRHGFHLNNGRKEFDQLTSDEQERNLANFDINEDLRLHLPADTQDTLAGLGCLLKETKSGFVLASEVQEVDSKFIPVRIPQRPFKIRIVMEVRAPRFWKYTNFPLGGRNYIYYLSNRAGQDSGTMPFLSLPAKPHDADKPYSPGDLVEKAGDVFLAAKSNDSSPTAAANKDWMKLEGQHYVSEADYASLLSPRFTLEPPQEMEHITGVRLVTQDGATHTFTASVAPKEPVEVDASRLPVGKYELVVSGLDASGTPVDSTSNIYLDPELPSRNVVVIVELFHLPEDALGVFRLYDEASGFALRSPQFMIRLLNRHTYWRYQFPEPVPATTNLGDLENISGQFVTKKLMPLTRAIQRVAFGDEKLLPNPSVDHIVAKAGRVYSDVHLHINP